MSAGAGGADGPRSDSGRAGPLEAFVHNREKLGRALDSLRINVQGRLQRLQDGSGDQASAEHRSVTAETDSQQRAAEAATDNAAPQRRFPANPLLRHRAEQQQWDRDVSKQLSQQAGYGSSSEDTSTSGVDFSICAVEVTQGRRRVYVSGADGQNFLIQDDKVHRNQRIKELVESYLLPNNYPQSVAPEYSEYMTWRGVQYFFGGAISVFTTRSLLGALGVNSRGANEAAAAINWVLKDGAGRLGRFLFARWGRQLDCELKQFRLMGDFLMEAGAALELSTIACPQAFLPLACTANLAKNLAAVANSATRAPIYRTFALENNMADITAKGESVANLADILGTFFGIALARTGWGIVPCFAGLSVGYLYASRREVDSVVLPYLNRARLAYASHWFLEAGEVPGPVEANRKEPLLPWRQQCGQGMFELGSTIQDACTGPGELSAALKSFKGLPYAITYRPEKKKFKVIFHESSQSQDFLQAAFHAHYCVYMSEEFRARGEFHRVDDLIRDSVKTAPTLFEQFISEANKSGWIMESTMLDSKDHRICEIKPV